MRNVVVITGPAGCGLSSAEYVFEELGYYVVKNAPSDSMRAIMDVLIMKDVKNIAFVAHIRSIQKVVNAVRAIKDINFRFILLNASEEELNKRIETIKNSAQFLSELKEQGYALIEKVIEIRAKARAEKNWALADEIRQTFDKIGIIFKDGKDKTIWLEKE